MLFEKRIRFVWESIRNFFFEHKKLMLLLLLFFCHFCGGGGGGWGGRLGGGTYKKFLSRNFLFLFFGWVQWVSHIFYFMVKIQKFIRILFFMVKKYKIFLGISVFGIFYWDHQIGRCQSISYYTLKLFRPMFPFSCFLSQ